MQGAFFTTLLFLQAKAKAQHNMDFNHDTNGIAALQKKIREYVSLLNVLKKKREDVKTLAGSLKGLSDEIMHGMEEQNIPSCASSGYTFTVKEKTKMKSATAKTFLVHVKDFFNISDLAMADFMEKVETQRREEAEIVTTLECRTQRTKKQADAPDGDASTFSSTVDDMYS
jgi:hypothetical protein